MSFWYFADVIIIFYNSASIERTVLPDPLLYSCKIVPNPPVEEEGLLVDFKPHFLVLILNADIVPPAAFDEVGLNKIILDPGGIVIVGAALFST